MTILNLLEFSDEDLSSMPDYMALVITDARKYNYEVVIVTINEDYDNVNNIARKLVVISSTEKDDHGPLSHNLVQLSDLFRTAHKIHLCLTPDLSDLLFTEACSNLAQTLYEHGEGTVVAIECDEHNFSAWLNTIAAIRMNKSTVIHGPVAAHVALCSAGTC